METLGYEAVQYSPTVGGPDLGLERQLRAAAAAGFDWCALDQASIERFLAGGGELDRLGELVTSLGLPCGQLQTLLVPAMGSEPPIVQARRMADTARVLQPATVQVICVGRPDAAVEEFRAAAALLRAAAPETLFAIEYIPVQRVNTIDAALGFARATGVEGFGLNLDTWHFFEGAEDWPDLERLAPEDIVHLQFSDHGPLRQPVDLIDEMMHRRVLPGLGQFDLPRFFEIVRAKGYHGRAGAEILSEEWRSVGPEEFATAVHAQASRFWGGPTTGD